jgi:hypothetical protein
MEPEGSLYLDIFNFVKCFVSNFTIGKIWGRLTFGGTLYLIIHFQSQLSSPKIKADWILACPFMQTVIIAVYLNL